MTQTEMIEELSKNTWLSKYRLTQVFWEMKKLFTVTLENSWTVSIAWIGKLSVVDTRERMYINPQTMWRISVKANKRVKFKVSSTLKNTIRI